MPLIVTFVFCRVKTFVSFLFLTFQRIIDHFPWVVYEAFQWKRSCRPQVAVMSIRQPTVVDYYSPNGSQALQEGLPV